MKTKKSDFIYLRIYEDIKKKIEDNQLKQGEKLKTEKELQQVYQISRDTLRKALGKLEQEGFIVRKAPLGTFVKSTKANYGLSKMESFSEQMKNRGISPSSELLSIELKSELRTEVKDALALNEGEKCYKVCRIRKGDDEPMSFEITYVPQKLCPNLQKHIDDHASLYEIYENIYHLEMKAGFISLEAELPSAYIQEKLNISKHAPILKMKCTLYLEDDTPLYYVESSYIGEKYFFSASIPR